jgi:hypothetical protein
MDNSLKTLPTKFIFSFINIFFHIPVALVRYRHFHGYTSATSLLIV